jgi:hypothetical protein
MKKWLAMVALAAVIGLQATAEPADAPLLVGFGEADVTPKLGTRPVYLAGFGQNRPATGVHDPLYVRAVVLRHGDRKVAIACADVVGLFLPTVERVRQRLPGFTYVLVCSTHNHEGPDTMGLWGPNPFVRGTDPAYLQRLEDQTVAAVQAADRATQPAAARVGTAAAPELLHDSRDPQVKMDELVAVEFRDPGTDRVRGLVVQWNCHPETLDSSNTLVSADFVGYTVSALHERYRCPVVFLNGAVGGLMTSLRVPVKDDDGKPLRDGTYEKTERYGKAVAKLAERAVGAAKPARLTPLEARSRSLVLPVDNKRYQLGKQLGVLDRDMVRWDGNPYAAPSEPLKELGGPLGVRTEIGRLRLGELDVAVIPGEIYPELVLGKVQDPPEPNADFPDAPAEPAIYHQLVGPYRMVVGLGNDELGYILPKRQWDEKPPFCYGLTKAPYGEVNSLGPETGPLLCKAFRDLVK